MAINSVVITLREVDAVMRHGDAKYGMDAWSEKPKEAEAGERRKHIDALYRHLCRFLNGETIDKDSNEPALAHVAARALMALEYDRRIRESSDVR